MFLRQLLGFFLLLLTISCGNQDYRESDLEKIQTRPIKEHPYWSQVYSFKDLDTVQLDIPVELSFEFVLEDLLSFETNKPNYIIKSSLYAYHNNEIAYELKNGEDSLSHMMAAVLPSMAARTPGYLNFLFLSITLSL